MRRMRSLRICAHWRTRTMRLWRQVTSSPEARRAIWDSEVGPIFEDLQTIDNVRVKVRDP